MANGLALSLSADFCEERVREEAISPAELVSVDVEGDGGSDRLTREARSTRRLGSLTTLRTRSGSAGRCSAAYWAECERHRGGAANANERETGDLLPSAVSLRYTTRGLEEKWGESGDRHEGRRRRRGARGSKLRSRKGGCDEVETRRRCKHYLRVEDVESCR